MDIGPSEMLIQFVVQIAPQLPLMMLYLIGIVTAAVRMQRHPRVSWLTIIGLALLLVWSLIGTLLSIAVLGGELNVTAVGASFSAINLIGVAVSVVAWICILIALFSGRPAAG